MKIFFSVRGTPWDKKCEKAKIKFKLKHFLSSMMEMFVCFFQKRRDTLYSKQSADTVTKQPNHGAIWFHNFWRHSCCDVKIIKELFDDTTIWSNLKS